MILIAITLGAGLALNRALRTMTTDMQVCFFLGGAATALWLLCVVAL